MPYVERTVVAGRVRETKKMYTSRYHKQGEKRQKHSQSTPDAQARVNERKAEEILRWKLNANFTAGDYHLVLHYYDKSVTLEQAEADKKEFLRLLRKECKKLEIQWKYVACTETKRMTNVHHHIILPAIPMDVLSRVWEKTLQERGGNISVKPLDKRGNHAKLASYLMKETRATVSRWKEYGKRYKRFSCSKGLLCPEPEYRVISANSWANEPRPKKGYVLLKDDNGTVARTGFCEVSGWPWQEYFELWADETSEPKHVRKRGRKKE